MTLTSLFDLKKIVFSFFLSLSVLLAFGQSDDMADWSHKDATLDSIQGMSVDRTYETLLKNRTSKTVTVAVIDSGIDINHEDLKDIIWVNEKEIAGNGIDDDKNGYVDDVSGWNFIGGKKGNVSDDTMELTREFVRLSNIYQPLVGKKIPKKKKKEYDQYLKIKDAYEESSKNQKRNVETYSHFYQQYSAGLDSVRKILKKDTLARSDFDSLAATSQLLMMTKAITLSEDFNGISPLEIEDQLKKIMDHYVEGQNMYNLTFDPRHIVGDNYEDTSERFYGNSDVIGSDATHGTHVAGIIGAVRDNNIGIRGIADNVRIMPVRAVPNGDERDKDVANAIRYAVDNGAQIINMSFGKSYSPQKKAVDAAVKYADKKGVLLIHAAGNDGKNIDIRDNFPSPVFLNSKTAANWIEVGASGPEASELAASFSNYGKNTVTLFSPGVRIYSTVPDNGYEYNDGTSMASPATSGVAALLLSYFPHLTAYQLKDILMRSVQLHPNLEVPKPGSYDTVKFSDLSITGGVLNAYKAVKMAIDTEHSLKK